MRTRVVHPNSPAPERRGSAFTIVELMVAVSLMILIIIALYGMFNQTQKALKSNVTQVDVMEAGRAAVAMIARELEQLQASGVARGTNLFAEVIPVPVVIQTDPNAPDNAPPLRTNVLQDIFYVLPQSNRWTGVGYRVIGARDGLGTLYRFQVHGTQTQTTNFLAAFRTEPVTNALTGQLSTNFHRIADGIIHMRLLAYDPEGRPVKLGWQNRYTGADGNPPDPNVSVHVDVAGQTAFAFVSNSIPAAVEFELGVLERDALDQYNLLKLGPPEIAANYLKERAHEVHLFRQRIPIRTAPR